MLTLFTNQGGASPEIDYRTICREDFGLCPDLFYIEREGLICSIGRDASVVASNDRLGLDALAIAEQTVLEFALGNRTVFSSVKRMLPWQRIVTRDGNLYIEDQQLDSPPPDILEYLSDQVCEALEQGAVLELTGGMDSRLMLAAGLRRNVRPNLAFTIGNNSSYDVVTARAIAEHFGFPHHTLPVVVDPSRIKEDTLEFIRASGYEVNATCYGWLPGTLAGLDALRTAQITGLVGEIAGSSYYTPFDAVIGPLRLERYWVKYRLMRPWIDWGRVWKPSVRRRIERELIDEALRDLNSFQGSWRERTDLFYKHKKIGRWTMPVLGASSHYYTVVAPLLSPEYCAWAVSLPVSERTNRKNERGLLERAHRELAHFTAPDGVPSPKLQKSMLGKIVKRLRRQQRESALGTVRAAEVLAANREIREYVEAMAHESDAGFDPEAVEHVVDSPREHPELLGMLITASVAWHDSKK